MSKKEYDVLDISDEELDKKTSAYILDELEHITKYKANLEQTRYGDFRDLVVPYRELPPIVYLRDSLPTPPGDVQSGVLYVLKEKNTDKYTAWIWDSSNEEYIQVGSKDVSWGNITGNISDQKDLNTIITQHLDKITKIENQITLLQTTVNDLTSRIGTLEVSYQEVVSLVAELNSKVIELEQQVNQFSEDVAKLKVDVSTLITDVNVIKTKITELDAAVANKQDKLSVGDNITIDANNKISAKDTTYSAGIGITIDANNVISASGAANWGSISGNIDDQTDLKEKFAHTNKLISVENWRASEAEQKLTDEKQDKLIPGLNITILDNNTISATDTTYSAGFGISIDDNNVISNTRDTKWGEIEGNIAQQTDLANALNELDTAKQDKLTAGTGITIDENNVISSYNSGAIWGTITGDIDSQTDLKEKFSHTNKLISLENWRATQIETGLQEDIDKINELIPAEASKTNQLADKNYVDTHIVDIELATETKIGGIYAAPYNSEEITSEVKIGENGKLYNKQISMNVDNETLKIKLSN